MKILPDIQVTGLDLPSLSLGSIIGAAIRCADGDGREAFGLLVQAVIVGSNAFSRDGEELMFLHSALFALVRSLSSPKIYQT